MSTVNRDGVFNFSIGEISFLALKTVGSLKISLPPCDLCKWLFGIFSYYEMALEFIQKRPSLQGAVGHG